jgi:hypothetical protein
MPSRRFRRARFHLCGTLVRIGAAAMTSSAAYAADPAASTFSFAGFGTAGVVHSSERNADFVGSVSQPNGAGYTHRWSADVDSKLGVQMFATAMERFSAAVQVVSEHRYDNTYTPDVEWAYAKYHVTPGLDVRIGRTADALYLQSDLRLVGYTYPWVRRPREIYGLIPINNKDGIDATYQFRFKDVTNSVQASYGRTNFKLSEGRRVRERDIFTLNNTIEYGPATVRVAYTTLRADLNNPGIDGYFSSLEQFGNMLSAGGLQPYGNQAVALADKYRFVKRRYSVVTVGASYDPGHWLLIAEWARTPVSPALFPPSTAWYVAGGYRFGRFTPYVTVARLAAHRPSPESGISTVGLPAALVPTAAAYNAGLNSIVDGFRFTQKTVSAGVRWDFTKNAALKLQYDRLTTGAGSPGLLGNVQPDFQPGSRINLISAAIDFVF